MNKIQKIKKMVEGECKELGFAQSWFYDVHLLGVEKFSKFLLKNLHSPSEYKPRADKEVVMLGVWLHDLQRIRGKNGDHQKVGAREAEKTMKAFGYHKETIKKVKDIIFTHSCSNKKPATLEGKILSSADAMAHYHNNFYMHIAMTGQMNFKEYREWILEKLDRNYNKKIYFSFAKKKIKDRHDLFKKIFTIN